MISSVLKSGRIYNIYSMGVSDVENPPHNALIGTVRAENDSDFRAQTGYRGIILDKNANVKPNEVEPVSASQVAGFVKEMGLDPNKVNGLQEGVVPASAPKPASPEEYRTIQTQIGEVYAGKDIQDKAINEFKLMLARHFANPKDERVKIATQSIGNFILKLWPDLKDDLEAAKVSMKQDEFSL